MDISGKANLLEAVRPMIVRDSKKKIQKLMKKHGITEDKEPHGALEDRCHS
jgi:hypothetical protein